MHTDQKGFFATFLGHQGWMISSGETRILIDPILGNEFGHGGNVGIPYPPKKLIPSSVPPITAVLISHEHEDHFNIPSLKRIDRAVPILLSAKSSTAARSILAEMGFCVELLEAGITRTIGDLEVVTFPADHVRDRNGDEWDTLQYIVRDHDNQGSMFSSVDVKPTPSALKAFCERKGIYCHSNNAFNWLPMHAARVDEGTHPYDSADLARELLTLEARFRSVGAIPAAVVISGSGFAFRGDSEWMNTNVFPVDAERVCAALNTLGAKRFFSPLPGETIRLMDGAVAGLSKSSFIDVSPRAEWPRRQFVGDIQMLEEYSPATGRDSVTSSEVEEIEFRLRDYALYLYGRSEFKALYSLGRHELGGMRPAVALAMLTNSRDDGLLTYEYDPAQCNFSRVDYAAPEEVYPVGVECWASDMLELLRGRLNPTAVVFGRWRTWALIASATPFKFWEYFHPLRRPAEFLAWYRELLSVETTDIDIRCAKRVEEDAGE